MRIFNKFVVRNFLNLKTATCNLRKQKISCSEKLMGLNFQILQNFDLIRAGDSINSNDRCFVDIFLKSILVITFPPFCPFFQEFKFGFSP